MGWHCQASGIYTTSTPVYNYPNADGLENCDQIYYILKGLGWTTNAIIGLITCIAFESGYNPWKWEGSIIPTTVNYTGATGNKGYGLVQWDPGSYNNLEEGTHQNKYIDNPHSINIPGYAPNFADQTGGLYDGYAQMVYLDDYGWVGQFYDSYHTYYSQLATSFASYKVSTAAASDLCETWTQNFERAGGSLDPDRRTLRQALASALWSNYQNKPVLPPDLPPGASFPVWLLLWWRQANMNRGRWY